MRCNGLIARCADWPPAALRCCCCCRTLCLKFPQKYRALMNFLSSALREEGGFEFKKAIVSSILILIQEIPEAKEPGLAHLCEFIEDCEFT